ncbi:MAG TPA: D-hexose-6-phosphate mutarotase [Spongiibacteraceae bacterium]|nr:D-hexose-6-phosphate mutarotase [Spongiibacteraceae bacterium]
MPAESILPASKMSSTQTLTASSVELVQLGELPMLRVHNNCATALIALQGGQVLEFVPRGERAIIWLSEQAAFKRGQSIRGGIPICWPWFGDLERNPAAVRAGLPASKMPAHGLVRAQPWLLESVVDQPALTRIVLRYPAAELSASWPHAADLTLTISIGTTLRLQLGTRNTGSTVDGTTLALTQALHTYFAISDIRQVEIDGFENTTYIDTLQDWREFPQQGAIRIDGEVDRIYRQVPAHIQLRDAGWQRTIHLRTHSSTSAVVWNPHIEKSKRLNQFAADAWQRMLCIETANVMDDNVVLAAGGEHVLELEIWSEGANS